ncbi:MAG: hypothetical protein CL908_13360 [Deltaproteobacteria bacterium]|nr:hypothetical protein [Deltaproteobacteria bacterium]
MTARALKEPGTYALVFERPRPARIEVGALGELAVAAGHFVYVGSAFGPGGLSGRLRHHLRPVDRPRWHIDYLRSDAVLLGVWLARGPRSLEHSWAKGLASLSGISSPHKGLGASDCRCSTHLFHSRRRPAGPWIRDCLERCSDGEPRVDYHRADTLRHRVLG